MPRHSEPFWKGGDIPGQTRKRRQERHAYPLSFPSVHQRKSMFPVVLKDEVSLTESATRYHLNGVRTAGIRFHGCKQLFIGRLPHVQPFHKGLRRLESNGQSRTRVAVKFDTSRKITARENLSSPIMFSCPFSLASA